MNSRYRSSTMAGKVIALSISYEKDNLLARGMGLEHLRELLVRLARPLLRRGASLARFFVINDVRGLAANVASCLSRKFQYSTVTGQAFTPVFSSGR